MTGDEMAEVREKLGLSQVQFARVIGYEGNRNTCELRIKRYENGTNPIPLRLARHVWLIAMACYGMKIALDDRGLPIWPEWLCYKRNEDGDIEDSTANHRGV
jgi:transcriptional regulator with XRE-family HTH domain